MGKDHRYVRKVADDLLRRRRVQIIGAWDLGAAAVDQHRKAQMIDPLPYFPVFSVLQMYLLERRMELHPGHMQIL